MAQIKSFTDIEQSTKLAKILPIESADCFWDYDDLQKYHRINWFEDGYDKDSQLRLSKNNVCAWSLAALISVLPKIHKLKPILDLEENSIQYSGVDLYVIGENPVDACYEMIIKLHERKML